MDWRSEWKALVAASAVFVASFYLPVGAPRFDAAVLEALHLVRWYAQEHVLMCLVPALFIAGAISVFVSRTSVMRYLGAQASRGVAYGVASVAGTVLAVCSCTVLPLFTGIYRRGAGLGPAAAFLYSGPAINVLAILLTARVLGVELGVARAVGAILLSVFVGVLMARIFRNERTELARTAVAAAPPEAGRPLWQTALFLGLMIAILVFANWAEPAWKSGPAYTLYQAKWHLTAQLGAGFALVLVAWFGAPLWKVALAALPAAALALTLPDPALLAFTAAAIGLAVLTASHDGELGEWFGATWDLAKQILPLLLLGVFVAGMLLGRPGHEGLIPSGWIASAVGGNSLGANLFASVAGSLMYFATLTEVPILQGLLGSGMGKGPALALLLAGPALSLPSILVLHSVLGVKKTAVFVGLVVVFSTVAGLTYGSLF
jgi:uncharacterized protein